MEQTEELTRWDGYAADVLAGVLDGFTPPFWVNVEPADGQTIRVFCTDHRGEIVEMTRIGLLTLQFVQSAIDGLGVEVIAETPTRRL